VFQRAGVQVVSDLAGLAACDVVLTSPDHEAVKAAALQGLV
jgi:hypothetical protein